VLVVVGKVFQSSFAHDSLRLDYPFMWSLKFKCMIKVVDTKRNLFMWSQVEILLGINFFTSILSYQLTPWHISLPHTLKWTPWSLSPLIYCSVLLTSAIKMYRFEKCLDIFARPIPHLLLPQKTRMQVVIYLSFLHVKELLPLT